jgi:hypothetical protein
LRIVARRIFPDRVFGRRSTTVAVLNAATAPDPAADHLHDLRDDLLVRALDPRLKNEEADGKLALELVLGPDHGALGDVRVRGQNLLDRSGRQAMAGYVDDVVGAGQHEHVARVIDVPSVGGLVVAGERRKVDLTEAFVCVPQCRGGAGGASAA